MTSAQGSRLRTAALAVLLATVAGAASATGMFPGGLKPADRDRLDDFDETREAAISAAREGGAATDVEILDAVLDGGTAELTPAELAGDWRCRTLKLGGVQPLVVYGYFRCRITDDAAGLRLEKLSGSQRTAGTFYDTGTARLGYAGALSVSGEPTRSYGDVPKYDQVGYLVPVSPNRLRLELPAPRLESRFDILELTR